MRAEADRSPIWAAAAELLAYTLVVGGFLAIYVTGFQEPAAVVGSHLAVLATLLVWPLGLRALVWKLGRGQGRAAGFLLALLMLLPLLLLFAWYGLVLIGLASWGRVTTWPLIWTYMGQAPHLLRALEISPWAVLVALVAVPVALLLVVWRWFVRRDWMRRLVARGSRTGVAAITMGLLLVASVLTWSLTRYGTGHPREPVALSFQLDTASRNLQSHVVSGSSILDARENEGRASYVPAKSAPQRNLIVIVGDALRADHMSVYGHGRETTPALASAVQAQDGAVVRGVRSACAESSCGLMALAASRAVTEIGSAPLTVQEVLRRNGYGVHFILGGDHTNFYGLRAMYGELDSYTDGSGQRLRYMNDDELVMDALAELPPAAPGHPIALQFHLMSTHGLGSRDPALSPFQPQENYYKWPGSNPRPAPDQDSAKAGVNYYDNGMRRFDSTVSRILEQLRQKGYLDDALVVVTGDHGEMLGEYSGFGHQSGVSEQVLNVPLLMLRYGYEGNGLGQRPFVGQIDIAPTILRELGVPAPGNWKGRALQDNWVSGEYTVQQGRIFGAYHVGDDGQVRKYVRDLDADTETVIDPTADPLGQRNLIQDTPKALLDRWRVQSTSMMFNTNGES